MSGIKTGDADINKDGYISVDELYDYAYEQVIKETTHQTPQKWESNIKGKIIISANLRFIKEKEWKEKATKLISEYGIKNDIVSSEFLEEIDKIFNDDSIVLEEKCFQLGRQYLCLGEALFENLRYDEGCNSFDLAAQIDEVNFDYYISQKGNAFVYLGNLDQAHIIYLEALEKNPDNWLAIIGESEILFQNGNIDKALDFVENAVVIAPESFEIWNQRGRILLKKNLLNEAMLSFERALSLSPDNPLILNNLDYSKHLIELKMR